MTRVAATSPRHGARILIVSALPGQASQLEGLLRKAGYSCVVGSHAPAFGAQQPMPVDLILLGLRLPDLQGFDAIAALLGDQSGEQSPPVLAIVDGPGELRQVLQAGARDCIASPFDAADLLSRVQRLLEGQRLHRERVALRQGMDQFLPQRSDAARHRVAAARRLASAPGRPGPMETSDTGTVWA